MATTTTGLGRSDGVNSVWVAVGSLAAVALVGLFSAAAKLPESAVNTLTSLAAGVVPAATLTRQKLRRSRDARLRDLTVSSDVAVVNPVYVALVLTSVVLLVDSAINGLLGMVVGIAFDTAGIADQQLLGAAVSRTILVVGIPITLLALFFIGRHVSHYLPRAALRWLVLAIVATIPVRVTVVLVLPEYLDQLGIRFSPLEAVIAYTVYAVVLFLPVWLGSLWGRRTRDSFTMVRRFHQLPPGDRAALLELVKSSAASELQRGD